MSRMPRWPRVAVFGSVRTSLVAQGKQAKTSGWSAVPPTSEEAKAHEEREMAAAAGGVASLLRSIEKEMDDEELRIDKELPLLAEGWDIRHEEGTSFFTLSRLWKDKERHTVRCNLSVRDVALDPECDIRGEHFPFRFICETISTGVTLDFVMDVVEGECVVDQIRTFASASLALDETSAGHHGRAASYQGPNLDEAEEEVLDGVQAFLAEREIDDQFAEFVGQYSVWVEQQEYERWLAELKTFVQAYVVRLRWTRDSLAAACRYSFAWCV